jgi:hypothetical protein
VRARFDNAERAAYAAGENADRLGEPNGVSRRVPHRVRIPLSRPLQGLAGGLGRMMRMNWFARFCGA